MCFVLASYYFTDQHIDLLLAEWKSNPDGGGVAYLERKKEKSDEGVIHHSRELKVEKGLMKKEQFRKCLRSITGKTVIAHVRYATHGDANPDNTHPFWTCTNNEAVMCHNGILPSPWSSSPDISDSRMMANTLKMLSFYDIVRDSSDIGQQIGWNKLVFLSRDGYLHIINDHLGEWLSKGSVWVSQRLTSFSRTYGAPRRHYEGTGTGYVRDSEESWHNENIHSMSDTEFQGSLT